jgi:hypothetical protein
MWFSNEMKKVKNRFFTYNLVPLPSGVPMKCETKRNEINENETKGNQQKQNEINEMKTKAKRNQRKQNLNIPIYDLSYVIVANFL